MHEAVTLDGVDLMGYTPWGCIDCSISFTTGEYGKTSRIDLMWIRHDDGRGDVAYEEEKNLSTGIKKSSKQMEKN